MDIAACTEEPWKAYALGTYTVMFLALPGQYTEVEGCCQGGGSRREEVTPRRVKVVDIGGYGVEQP